MCGVRPNEMIGRRLATSDLIEDAGDAHDATVDAALVALGPVGTIISTPVEGRRLGRPGQTLEPIPERLGLDRIVEQDRVTEIAQVAARDGVDPGLVE